MKRKRVNLTKVSRQQSQVKTIKLFQNERLSLIIVNVETNAYIRMGENKIL